MAGINKNWLALGESRFASKILLVALSTISLPILIAVFFVIFHITNLLQNNNQEELLRNSKFFALHVFDKLSIADDELNHLISDQSLLHPNALSDRVFKHYTSIQRTQITPTELTQLYPGSIAHLLAGKTLLATHRARDGNPQVKLVIARPSSDSHLTHIEAIIDPAFLWGKPDSMISLEKICVSTVSGMELSCTSDALRNLLAEDSLDEPKKEAVRKRIPPKQNESSLAYESWDLFLGARFSAEDWRFTSAKKDSEMLATIGQFKNLFLPLSGAAFLFSSLVCFIWVRKLLQPINQLSAATESLKQGDFNTLVRIKSKDEIQDLGQAFNQMTSSLRYQFKKNDALALIEHLAIKNESFTHIITATLLKAIETADVSWLACIINKNEDADRIATFYARKNQSTQLLLPKEDNLDLGVSNKPYAICAKEELVGYLPEDITSNGEASIIVLPIGEHKDIVGYIAFEKSSDASRFNTQTEFFHELSLRYAIVHSAIIKDKKIYQQAHFDSLTRLPNRFHLTQLIQNELKQARKSKTTIAALHISLNQFKNVNEFSGYSVGNIILQKIAKRLSGIVRKKSNLSRLGGDEFCIVIETWNYPNKAEELAENIIEQFKIPFHYKETYHYVGVSIGIAANEDSSTSADQLLQNASIAAEVAKKDRDTSIALFSSDIKHEVQRKQELERDLRYVTEREQVLVKYQPKVEIHSQLPCSAEALIRWNHPRHGLVPTEWFIKLAEETGAIKTIGEWVLSEACAQFVEWKNRGLELLSISVNVSAQQLLDPYFADKVGNIINTTGIQASALDLEITESSFADFDSPILDQLNAVKELGVSISIDDFGKEYSSLNYLKSLPFDILKIDKDFISDLENSDTERKIVSSIIQMAHSLRKEVIVEGIETAEQAAILASFDCDYGQGYFFNKPLDADEFYSSTIALLDLKREYAS